MSGPDRRTEKQKMLAGELYRASDPELQADAAAAKAWMVRYNASLGAPPAQQRALLVERLAHVGADAVIRPPSSATMATTSASATAPS